MSAISVVISQTSALARAIVLFVVAMICRHKLTEYYDDYDSFTAMNNMNLLVYVTSVFDFITAAFFAYILQKRHIQAQTSLIVKLIFIALTAMAIPTALIVDIWSKLEHPDEKDSYVDTRTTYLCGLCISALLTLIQLTSYMYLCTCASRYYIQNLRTHHVDIDGDTKHLWIPHTDLTKTKDGDLNNVHTQKQWLHSHSFYPQKHPVSIV